MRRLLCTRRRVPLDIVDDYLLAWGATRALVEAADGRAWLFRQAGHDDLFMEFIEWDDNRATPLQNEGVEDARRILDNFTPGSGSDEWEEAG